MSVVRGFTWTWVGTSTTTWTGVTRLAALALVGFIAGVTLGIAGF
jgi:hypothetical protein